VGGPREPLGAHQATSPKSMRISSSETALAPALEARGVSSRDVALAPVNL
jgi:hypothetical protein